MITTAAPASRAPRLPSPECDAAVTPCPRQATVTCSYATKVTIYSCRNYAWTSMTTSGERLI
jgi:hypothetical protein